MDSEIGLSVVDRFSHKFFEFINEATPDSTIQTFIDYLNPVFLGSTPVYRGDLFDRPADQIKIFDFIAVKPREDVESGIEECEFVYEKVKGDIPDIPDIPSIPGIPSIPSIPDIPSIFSIPDNKEITDIFHDKEIHKTTSKRIIYNIDFHKKPSNNLNLLIFIITSSCLIRSIL